MYCVLFYDVTNFYFEIGDPDPDEEDEDGTVIGKGSRQKGVSKTHRNQPIVQMAMFLDNSGIPMAINMFPGNTLDHQTAVPTYEETISKMGFDSRFIFIADKGICTGPIMCRLLDDGNGYIISKSLKKSTKKDREWAVDQAGYTVVDKNFKYKSRILTVTVDKESKKAGGPQGLDIRNVRTPGTEGTAEMESTPDESGKLLVRRSE